MSCSAQSVNCHGDDDDRACDDFSNPVRQSCLRACVDGLPELVGGALRDYGDSEPFRAVGAAWFLVSDAAEGEQDGPQGSAFRVFVGGWFEAGGILPAAWRMIRRDARSRVGRRKGC